MNTLGMPTSMFLVFAAVVLAGSLGAIHYVIVHVLLRRPFGDEAVGGATSGTSATGAGGGVAAGPSGAGRGDEERE